MAFELSICIVNYNSKEYLNKCLTSIYSNPFKKSFEVIVVDNNSSDNSPALIKEKFPYVMILENQENNGFTKANNQGVRISKGRYVLSLNPDTVVLPEALNTLVDFMDNHPEAGGCGPNVLNSNGTILNCSPLSRQKSGMYLVHSLRSLPWI